MCPLSRTSIHSYGETDISEKGGMLKCHIVYMGMAKSTEAKYYSDEDINALTNTFYFSFRTILGCTQTA
mgnify:CR=1 FL=1